MSGETDYPGIDYGLGQSNVDPETGIRFGVINMNALDQWAWESVEADYGEPTCPKCGNAVKDYDDLDEEEDGPEEELENYHEHSCADYVCASCGIILGSDDVYGDEPNGHVLDDGDYKGFVDSSNDLMIIKSPYYTRAQFCSPCAPGAGHLEHPCASGPRTYCLGHDWFEGGVAPYPVFRVGTDEEVPPSDKK